MIDFWKKVKPAVEWGFFFGIISWLWATGVTNNISALGVWFIVLSRTAAGLIFATVKWESTWLQRGAIVGAITSLPVAIVGAGWSEFSMGKSLIFLWIPGIICGIATDFFYRRYLKRHAEGAITS